MTDKLEGAPETIWADDFGHSWKCKPIHQIKAKEYTRKDISDKRIAELEDQLSKHNRHSDVIRNEFNSQALKADTP